MTITDRGLLASSGIPFVLWGQDDFDNGDVQTELRQEVLGLDAAELYDAGTNIVITGGGPARMKVASVMAQRFMNQSNRYYRVEGENKRAHDDLSYLKGEVFTQPFKVKMMKVDALMTEFKNAYEDESFVTNVLEPDFFFLCELGSEWSSSFTAKVVMDLFTAREMAALPTVVSLTKKISDVMDKSGVEVYRDNVAQVVKRWITTGRKLVVR